MHTVGVWVLLEHAYYWCVHAVGVHNVGVCIMLVCAFVGVCILLVRAYYWCVHISWCVRIVGVCVPLVCAYC